ncbi:hypothetical protein N7516_004576 [Penicillium verrucosum]|uniref:uncharacterized protein n=1 Tax=Penicillium verrucosum TaxID=60171 RepID=UPI002545B583|nr:uncharacterized protein N7516_004576 [Penicillium verrucosum]KAJ5944408.1 hypothetical protein N7516_004576 [Penicillium verrucosum]
MAMASMCLRGGDTGTPDENTGVLGEMHNNSSQPNSTCQSPELQITDDPGFSVTIPRPTGASGRSATRFPVTMTASIVSCPRAHDHLPV